MDSAHHAEARFKTQAGSVRKIVRGALAYNIRLLRFKNGLSPEELAFRYELDMAYISAVVRCVWDVALGNIEKIAGALDVEPWRLLVPPHGHGK